MTMMVQIYNKYYYLCTVAQKKHKIPLDSHSQIIEEAGLMCLILYFLRTRPWECTGRELRRGCPA